MKKFMTLTREKLYRHLVYQQMSVAQIAKLYDLAEVTIYKRIKKYDIDYVQERINHINNLKEKQVSKVNSMNAWGVKSFYSTKRYNDTYYNNI